MTKGSTLIGIEAVMGMLATGHPTDGMDEVTAIKILKPILIRVMGVGLTVKVQSRGVLNPILITSVL